ncbi:hypothetical protein [Archangium sp.]|uniref:hypothetical protein n=1 Tax=Archangium sp. TaxID=1872627 RepID=UPI002D2A92FA|nr:hypothetical protein [Archangium sp.]HYO52365.1 hypothetical protein [Archangium sp.]
MSKRFRSAVGQLNPESPQQLVSAAQMLFEDAVARAALLDTSRDETSRQLVQTLIQTTQQDFRELSKYVQERERADEPISRRDRDEALALARRRAYVLPVEELSVEADALVSEMRDLGVPVPVVAELEKLARRLSEEKNEPVKRALLNRILEDYDYWDWYVDWYSTNISIASIALGIGAIATLAIALRLAFQGNHVIAVLFSAASGAAVSILGRLPPMTVYGDAASLYMRMSTRLFSGILASCTGMWLFTSGAIQVNLGDKSLKAIASTCIDGVRPEECTPTSFLLLVTLAVLLGFSERAFTSFERVLPTGGEAPRKPPAGDVPSK